MCVQTENLRLEYIIELKKELAKIKTYREDCNKVEKIINNIEVYLN